jgi:predicted NBD/HSP70 family sugar kinase
MASGYASRSLNKATVFNLLRDRGAISRVELARETGLSKATISEIVDGFIGSGYVRVLGPGESSGGRRPVLLEFDPEAHLAIGIGFSDDSITAVLADLRAQPLRKCSAEVHTHSPEEAVEISERLVADLVAGVPREKLLGIGIGAPGVVDSQTGVVKIAPGWRWQDVPIGKRIADRFGLPVAAVNRSKASALGEAWCGAGRQAANLVYVLVGSGISAGIVVGGELYRGVTMSEGEIAHVTVAPGGPLCHCGNRGCLRAVATEDAILAKARERIRDGHPTAMRKMIEGRVDLLTLHTLAQAAEADDELASSLVEEVAGHIGIATSGLVNILNPQMLILGGTVVETIPKLLRSVEAETRRRAVAISSAALRVVASPLGRDAASIGAAAFLLSQISPIGEMTSRMVTLPKRPRLVPAALPSA